MTTDVEPSKIHYAYRSAYERYQRCPRAYMWQYVYNGIGVVRARLDVPLARGIYVHRGLEKLLLGQTIDQAIKFAIGEFDREIGERGLEVASLEDSSYVYKEQKALIEAMLYGWWKKRLPVLLEQYDVLEVEHEEVWDLGTFDTQVGKCNLVWLGKADGLLKEKDSGDLFIQSFKTTADWDTRKDSAAMHDVQGMSELCAVEHRLEEWWSVAQKWKKGMESPNWNAQNFGKPLLDHLMACEQPPKIMGIRMEHLLSGDRRDPGKGAKATGQKIQYSPLIRIYKKDGITPELDEFAWKFTWDDEFGSHRLGKGWRPLNAWEQEGGVRAWIDLMVEKQIQADLGDCLDNQFVYPQPYYRQEEDVQDWLQQMIAQELRKFEARQRLEQVESPDEVQFVLNTMFPQHRHSCDYPRLCEMAEICFSPGYAEDPVRSGMYKFRDGHHDTEKKVLAERLIQIQK